MKDPILDSYTHEELMIEFLQDLIEQNPAEALPSDYQENVVFRTGDKVIDRWERQMAEGRGIDVFDAFRPEEHGLLKRFMTDREAFMRKSRFGAAATPPGFSDTYKKR